jgi:hypothetical protein
MPHVTHLDAYYELIASEDPAVDLQSARLVREGSTTSLVAEWTENRERWEMRLVSIGGPEYRGSMQCKEYDEPSRTRARMWELKDGYLWVGHYETDEGDEEPFFIHAVPATDDE